MDCWRRVDERERQIQLERALWAENKSFLTAPASAQVTGEKATSGTVFIGWDPQTGQINPWLFDLDGGHGEGLRTRTGEQEWVVKTYGVLRDGRPRQPQIHVVLNKDSAKTSFHRTWIVGGDSAPTSRMS